MSMNAGKGLKHEPQFQWMRGQPAEAGMGSGRHDVYSHSASDHPHHHPTSYYSQPSVYPYSASGNPHPQSWTSNDVHRPMSFLPPQSYMNDVSAADHTQYMDMFAPTHTTTYSYNNYTSSFFTQPSPLTGAGGECPFWGQHKHPVLGSSSGYRAADVPFFGSNNQYRTDRSDESIEAGISSLSLDRHGNGYSASNGLPSSGSEVSDFSTEQEHQLTGYQSRVSGSSSGHVSGQRQGRKANQSWASVASQPVRSSLRSKHSLPSSRLLPAPNTDAIVAWDQNPSSSLKSPLPVPAVDPSPPVSQVSEEVADPVSDQHFSGQRKTVVPPESSSWVLMNDQPSPPLRLETKSVGEKQNVPPQSVAAGRPNHCISEPVTNQRRPIVAIRDSNRDAFIGEHRGDRKEDSLPAGSQSFRRSEDSRNSNKAYPDGKIKSNASRSAADKAALKPVIDPSALKDRQQLDHIFNPKEFDLNPAEARFFVIKSYSEDDIHRSIKYSIWCSTERGNKRLDVAFRKTMSEGGVIYLFFSVNGSGHFCGMAQMLSPLDYNSSANVWAQDKWKGQFKVRWIYVKDVPNAQLRHIRLENNENKPVTNSRDTQEVPPDKGRMVLSILHSFRHTTSIFDDFLHYEKRQEEETHRRVDTHESYSQQPLARDRGDTRSREEPQHRNSYHEEHDRSDNRRLYLPDDSRDQQSQNDGRAGRRYDVQRDAYNQDQHRNRNYPKPQQRENAYVRYDRSDQSHFSRSHQQSTQRSD